MEILRQTDVLQAWGGAKTEYGNRVFVKLTFPKKQMKEAIESALSGQVIE